MRLKIRAMVVAGLFALTVLPPLPVSAATGTVLFLQPTLGNAINFSQSHYEQAASSLGYSLEVVNADQWNLKTAGQFSSYRAIVLGDALNADASNCWSANASPLSGAEKNASTWGPQIRGNVAVMGSDPTFHANLGTAAARTLINDAVSFAASGTATGAVVVLGCYYEFLAGSNAVPVLDAIKAGFKVTGGEQGGIQIVSGAPMPLTGLSNENLGNWGSSFHETFDSWPADFVPQVIATNAPCQTAVPPTCASSTYGAVTGRPYILARSSVAVALGLTPSPGTAFAQSPFTLTANLTQGTALVGQTVSFSVTGSNTTAGTAVTDSAGNASFTYTGTKTGNDYVIASYADPLGAAHSSSAAIVGWEPAALHGVAICGTYLLRYAQVQLFAGGVPLPDGTTTTDANGTWSLSPTIPIPPAGTLTVKYTGKVWTTESGRPISCGATIGSNGLALPTPPITNLHNHTWPAAYALTSGMSVNDYLFSPGQTAWFKVPIKPGQKVTAQILKLPTNDVLRMFRDIDQVYQQVPSTAADVRRLTAGIAPDGLAPDGLAPDGLAPDGLAPDGLAPDGLAPDGLAPDGLAPDGLAPDGLAPDGLAPDGLAPDGLAPDGLAPDGLAAANGTELDPKAYSSAVARAFLAISGHPGRSTQQIKRNTWDNTGNFYFSVRCANGCSDPANPFTILVTVDDSACTNVTLTKTPAKAGPGGTPKTLILTNTARVPGGKDASFMNALNNLAALPAVGGLVIDLAGDTNGLDMDYTQWDNSPSCPSAANVVASAIHDLIDPYRNTLKYVVIAGDDRAVPYLRLPDQAGLGSEKTYNPPLGDSTESRAALRLGYFLSQDYYASAAPITRFDHSLWVPDQGVSIGRLVESAAEIKAGIALYTPNLGGPAPVATKALVTGYDALSIEANDLVAQLSGGGLNVDGSLIQPVRPGGVGAAGTTIPKPWTADDLRAKLAPHYDLIALNGHFSANRALAADYQTHFLASEVAGVTDKRYQGSVVMSTGCHSGYNIVDSDAISGLTQAVDFPEAFVSQGATLLGSTGYGYFDTELIKYTERLLSGTTLQLRYGTGSVPIGDAVTAAKLSYLQQLSKLGGIDEKSVGSFTLYGLPMFGVNLPGGVRLARPGSAGNLPLTTGSSTGLAFANVNSSYTLHQNNLLLPVIGTTVVPTPTQTVTYYDAGKDALGQPSVQAQPGEPLLPLAVQQVTGAPFGAYASPVARGVVLTSASFTDVTAFRPLVDVATTESIGIHRNFVTAVRTPVRPFGLNELVDQSLYLVPMQYVSSGNNSYGTARLFDSMSVRVYYTGLTGAKAAAGAPIIYNTSVTATAGGLHIDVLSGAQASVGIEDIWATYAIAGKWTGVQLTRGTPQPTITYPTNADALVVHYTGDIALAAGTAPETVPVFIQAVGGNGLVSYATNSGAYYFAAARLPSASAPPKLTNLQLTAASSANYLDVIPVSATLTDVDNKVVANESIVFSLGDLRAFATTNGSGVASAQLPVRAQPGSTYAVSANFDGDANYQAAPTATKDITVNKVTPSLTLSQPLVLANPSRGILASLKVGNKGLNEQPLTVDTGAGGKAMLITDSYGRLVFDTTDLNLGPGCYTTGVSYDGNDRYNAVGPVNGLVVVPAPANITLTSSTAPKPTGSSITVSAKVVQSAGQKCDLSKGTLTYVLKEPATGKTYAQAGVGIDILGNSSTTFTGVVTGLYAIEITAGGYLTGSFSTTGDNPLPVYDPARLAAGAGQLPTSSSTIGLPGGKLIFFGFAAGYQTSATTPSGAFGFRAQDPVTFGVLNAFGITAGGSFDWFVVTPNRAVLQGTGTLDGVANQKFRLEARILPNGSQTIEVHVWDPNASSGKAFTSPKILFTGPFTPIERDDGTGGGLIFR